MKQLLKRLWAAMAAAYRRRSLQSAHLRAMRHLDSRTLKDIGVEAWNSDLARRLEAMQHRDRLVWRAELGFGGIR